MKLQTIKGITLFLLVLLFVPYVGFVLSMLVMLILLYKFADADLFPDAVLIVVIAQGLEFVAGAILVANLVKNMGGI